MEIRLKWKSGINKTSNRSQLSNNWTEPMHWMGIEWPFGNATDKLVVRIEKVKELKEQQTWWVALVSKTHNFEEIIELEKDQEEEIIPLKLQVEDLGCCNSRETQGLPYSCELKSAMSCWHCEGVNRPKEFSI